MATCALTCANAKKIDLVDYLASLGHRPQKVSHSDYWYLSPFRDEKTASFKVNRKLNVWYDHGLGKGGDLIDFGTRFYNCSVSDFLNQLAGQLKLNSLSFHPLTQASKKGLRPAIRDTFSAGEKKENPDSKIFIVGDRPIASPPLLEYLKKRCIPPEIAERFCREVDFLLYGKKHTVIGFKNNTGGYELRNENFKGSSSPKGVTFIDNNKDQVAVFEGFFNYLAFQTLSQHEVQPQANFLILNSLSFFEKCRDLMESHREIHLLLDRDTAGVNYTNKALAWDNKKYRDRSDLYENYKDLNDWFIHDRGDTRQEIRRGRRI